MHIAVLGSFSIERTNVSVDLGPRLERLLAALVVADGETVSSDALIDAVWGDDAPAGADSTLKSYVTRLRKALDVGSDVLRFQRPGYRLVLPEGSVDARDFDREVDAARRALRQGDTAEAHRLAMVARGRWRGAAYAGLAEEEWVRPEAVRLELRRTEAAEIAVEALVLAGRSAEAVADAQRLVEAQPLREQPRALLMRALHADGRQTEALRVLPSFRRFLAEEAGLEPSSDLADLERRIASSDSRSIAPASALRGYELGERIGEGAFAVVHKATQPGVDRTVAIKIIRAELADRPEFIRRFEFEARTIASIEHPNVVPVHDFWREPGAAYLVMRWLQGGSVADLLLRRGRLSPSEVVTILSDVTPALEAAHRLGVVHRDVRPANLLRDGDGVTYLADFGIATQTASLGEAPIISLAHAAPEVLNGGSITPRADVLSLAMTVFELLSGRLPFADSPDRETLIRRQQTEPLPSLAGSLPGVGSKLDAVLARATASDPTVRHATVSALVDDVVSALEVPTSTPLVARSRTPGPNPYLGLQAFDEGDADRFFGRTALVEEVLTELGQRSLVALVGPSGAGKSSVVRAGVIPRVRAGGVDGSSDWFVTSMVPGSDPFVALEAALLRVAVNPPATLLSQLREPGGMARSIRRAVPDDGSTLLLLIDQFEELFTLDTGESERFLDELSGALSGANDIRVLATLRADHYDEPLRHSGLAELVTDGTVTVRPMTQSELEEAIVRPAEEAGVSVEPALAAELKLAARGRAAPLPLVQFALTELYEQQADGVLRVEAFEAIGGVFGAVAVRADQVVERGGAAADAAARRLFGRLVTLGDGREDSRQRVKRSEVELDGEAADLIDQFVEARLLTTDRDPSSGEPTVEVAHEALLREWPRLRNWLDEDRSDLRLLERISQESRAWLSTRDASDLARGARLDGALDLLERRPELLSENEGSWIDASARAARAELAVAEQRAERERSRSQQLRRLLAVAVALLVIASVATVAGFVLRSQALSSAESARIEALVAESAAQFENDPSLSLLLALEANRRRDDATTQGAVLRALASEARLQAVIELPFGPEGSAPTVYAESGVIGVAFEQAGESSRIAAFDPGTGQILAGPQTVRAPISDLDVSDDGSLLAAVGFDGELRLLDPQLNEVPHAIELSEPVITADLNSDGSIVALSDRAGVVFADTRTGAVINGYEIAAHEALDLSAIEQTGLPTQLIHRMSDTRLSPDGTLAMVAIGDDFSGGEFWSAFDLVDVATGERLSTPAQGLEFFPPAEFSLEGEIIAIGTGREVELVSVSDGGDVEPLGAVNGHAERVEVVAFGTGPGGAPVVATMSLDGEARFSGPDGTLIDDPVSIVGDAGAATFLPDGGLAVSRRNGNSLVVDSNRSRLVRTIFPERFNHIPRAGGYYDAPTADFTSARIHALPSGELISELPTAEVLGSMGPVLPRWSLDGKWIMTYSLFDEGLAGFFAIDGSESYVLDIRSLHRQLFDAEYGETSNVALRPAPDGSYAIGLMAMDNRSRAFTADLQTGQIIDGPLELEGPAPITVLPDGRVGFGALDAPILVLPADMEGDPVELAGTNGGQIYDVDDVTGNVLYGGPDGLAGIGDPDDGSTELFVGGDGVYVSGAFSPDGDRAVLQSLSGELQVFDVETKTAVGAPLVLPGSNPSMSGMWWEPDDEVLWTSTLQGVVGVVMDPDEWREIACQVAGRELTGVEWDRFVAQDEDPVASCS